jgi:5-formyltetrahydrofolate cyclo-ligase
MRAKPITRRTVLSRRDALTDGERAAASDAIAARVDGEVLAALPAGAIVAVYSPKGSEVDTRKIDAHARQRGLRVVYPRIVDGERRLAFYEVTLDELVPGHFGLREPAADALPAIELVTIAAYLVPGIAFDRSGGRIGWGRGYYDATLAAADPSALRIGVAFDCQLMEQVPSDPHDAALHYVVTEAATYRGAVQ